MIIEKENDRGDEATGKKIGDIISERIGSFGRWHVVFFLLVVLPVKFSSYTALLGIIFLAPHTTFRCIDTNLTDVIENSTCYSDCIQYQYYSQFENTIISEWDLVCDRAWLANLVQTLNMCGILVGGIVFGYISDRFGRRPANLAACMLQLLSSFVIALCSEFWAFAVLRFILGIATAGNMICSFVMLLEVTGPSHIELATSLFHIPLAIGEIALPVLGYYLRNWDTFSTAIAIPNILYLLYFFILPESPKWLISIGRLNDASVVMTKIAKCNKLSTGDMLSTAKMVAKEAKVELVQKKATYWDLLTLPNLRTKNMCSCISWMLLGAIYYGCNQYVGQTSSNVFLTMPLIGVLKIPIVMFSGYMYKRYGRRSTAVGFLVLNAICCGVLALPDDWFYTRLAAGTLGVNFGAGAFTALYVFTTELFPTVARNMAMGASSTSSRIGSSLAPFIVGLNAVLWLPPTIFSVLCLINVVVCCFLPETKGKKLTNTLFEAK